MARREKGGDECQSRHLATDDEGRTIRVNTAAAVLVDGFFCSVTFLHSRSLWAGLGGFVCVMYGLVVVVFMISCLLFVTVMEVNLNLPFGQIR